MFICCRKLTISSKFFLNKYCKYVYSNLTIDFHIVIYRESATNLTLFSSALVYCVYFHIVIFCNHCSSNFWILDISCIVQTWHLFPFRWIWFISLIVVCLWWVLCCGRRLCHTKTKYQNSRAIALQVIWNNLLIYTTIYLLSVNNNKIILNNIIMCNIPL